MSLNDLILEITKIEGKKKQVDIAQVREIVRTIGVINKRTNGEAVKTLAAYTKRLK